MTGHNIHFIGVKWTIILKLSLLPLLYWSTGYLLHLHVINYKMGFPVSKSTQICKLGLEIVKKIMLNSAEQIILNVH